LPGADVGLIRADPVRPTAVRGVPDAVGAAESRDIPPVDSEPGPLGAEVVPAAARAGPQAGRPGRHHPHHAPVAPSLCREANPLRPQLLHGGSQSPTASRTEAGGVAVLSQPASVFNPSVWCCALRAAW